MEILKEYELKILLALAAVGAFAASSMDYYHPTAAVLIRILGWALLVWSIIEPKQEVEEDA